MHDGQVIKQAINNLTMLREAVEKDYVTANGVSKWLFGGLSGKRLLKVCVVPDLHVSELCFTLCYEINEKNDSFYVFRHVFYGKLCSG